MSSTDELALLAAIADDPTDHDRRLVLADWLEDRGDRRGELLRLHVGLLRLPPGTDTPTARADEARLRVLLTDGIRPCVPRFVNSVGMEFVQVPPGHFFMGSPTDELGRVSNETSHRVTLTRPFWFGVTPVTGDQYAAVVGRRFGHWSSRPEGGGLPAECVTRQIAVDFCQSLTEREEGRQYRLPTEAEWEWACRAGVPFPQAYHFGPELPPRAANVALGRTEADDEDIAPREGRTTPVGTSGPNAWGLFDLHGNVWEWTSDTYRRHPRRAQTDPTGGRSHMGVLKGGSWFDSASRARSAHRHTISPSSTGSAVGFRVVCVFAVPRRFNSSE